MGMMQGFSLRGTGQPPSLSPTPNRSVISNVLPDRTEVGHGGPRKSLGREFDAQPLNKESSSLSSQDLAERYAQELGAALGRPVSVGELLRAWNEQTRRGQPQTYKNWLIESRFAAHQAGTIETRFPLPGVAYDPKTLTPEGKLRPEARLQPGAEVRPVTTPLTVEEQRAITTGEEAEGPPLPVFAPVADEFLRGPGPMTRIDFDVDFIKQWQQLFPGMNSAQAKKFYEDHFTGTTPANKPISELLTQDDKDFLTEQGLNTETNARHYLALKFLDNKAQGTIQSDEVAPTVLGGESQSQFFRTLNEISEQGYKDAVKDDEKRALARFTQLLIRNGIFSEGQILTPDYVKNVLRPRLDAFIAAGGNDNIAAGRTTTNEFNRSGVPDMILPDEYAQLVQNQEKIVNDSQRYVQQVAGAIREQAKELGLSPAVTEKLVKEFTDAMQNRHKAAVEATKVQGFAASAPLYLARDFVGDQAVAALESVFAIETLPFTLANRVRELGLPVNDAAIAQIAEQIKQNINAAEKDVPILDRTGASGIDDSINTAIVSATTPGTADFRTEFATPDQIAIHETRMAAAGKRDYRSDAFRRPGGALSVVGQYRAQINTLQTKARTVGLDDKEQSLLSTLSNLVGRFTSDDPAPQRVARIPLPQRKMTGPEMFGEDWQAPGFDPEWQQQQLDEYNQSLPELQTRPGALTLFPSELGRAGFYGVEVQDYSVPGLERRGPRPMGGHEVVPTAAEQQSMITRQLPSALSAFQRSAALSGAETQQFQTAFPGLRKEYEQQVQRIAQQTGSSFDPRSITDPRFIPTIAAGEGQAQRPAFDTFEQFLTKRRKAGAFQPPQQTGTTSAIPFNRQLLRTTYQ